MVLMSRVAAVLAGLLLALLPPVSSEAGRDRAGHTGWQGLDVWHFRYRTLPDGRSYPVAIKFHGNELRYPREGVVAIAATADAAIVQVNDYGQRTRLGRLVELPATGEAGRRLDKHPLGTVIADPNGHVAFWTSRRPDGPHLVALDTSTGTKVVGPAVQSGQRVFAVEGTTAYVVQGVWRPDPVISTWSPGQPTLTALPAAFSHGGIVSDVSGDRAISFDFDDGLYVTDRMGTLLRTLPVFFGTFSPDAAHVVGLHGNRIVLYATETGARVRFTGLHGRTGSFARWSPGGVLVLDTIPHGAELYGTDDTVVTFACTPADARCLRLPGSVISEGSPFLQSDAFGQFFDFVPSS
jgi:hypothetical protein